MAEGRGLEPQFAGPEPDVLPLDDPSMHNFGPAQLTGTFTPSLEVFLARLSWRQYLLDTPWPRARVHRSGRGLTPPMRPPMSAPKGRE